jgi:hypothetical protein
MLHAHGYLSIKPCQREHARLRSATGALAVIFESGSVLCQGTNTKPLLDLLNSLSSDTDLDLFAETGAAV